MLFICQSSSMLVQREPAVLQRDRGPRRDSAGHPPALGAGHVFHQPERIRRCASVSWALGRTSSRSRESWSAGVVVVRPQPGHGKPGQSTQLTASYGLGRRRH